MVTLVGIQENFNDVIVDLLELEHDACGAYKLAIEKLSDLTCKAKMESFLLDHKKHIENITGYYSSRIDLPKSGNLIKGALAKMKVEVGNITNSDINILKAMLDNEMDTNTAYKRIIEHPNLPEDMRDIFNSAYQDEKKHKIWLENYIEEYE